LTDWISFGVHRARRSGIFSMRRNCSTLYFKVLPYLYCSNREVMKRTLILLRHTKSDWGDFSLPDFDRPIKKDRVDDAKDMANKLKSLDLYPDLIICSPAKRTRQTVEYFCDKLKYDYDNIEFDKRIYESTAEDVLQVIRETDAGVKTLMVVGHNPSLTDLANMFSENSIAEVPTTGVVWLEFSIKNWEIYKLTPCKFKALLTPKTI